MNINITYKTLTTLLCALITGCGGSSTPSSTSTTSLPSVTTVTGKIQQASECGGAVAPKKAELYFYDKDWHIIARTLAAPDGTIRAETPATAVHLGFAVMNETAFRAEIKAELKVFAQTNSGNFGTLILGVRKIDETCDCERFNSTLSKANSNTSSNLYVSSDSALGRRQIKYSDAPRSFGWCRQPGHPWPMLTFTTGAADAEYFYDQINNVKVGETIAVNLSRTGKKVTVTNNTPPALLSVAMYGDMGPVVSYARNNEVAIPTDLIGVKLLTFRGFLIDTLPDTSEYYSSHAVTHSTTNVTSVNLTYPRLADAKAFISNYIQTFRAQSATGAYDFSNFTDFQLLNVNFLFMMNDSDLARVEITAPLKGSMPSTLFPSDIGTNESTTALKYASAELWGSANSLTNTQLQLQTINQYSPLPSAVSRPADLRYLGFSLAGE